MAPTTRSKTNNDRNVIFHALKDKPRKETPSKSVKDATLNQTIDQLPCFVDAHKAYQGGEMSEEFYFHCMLIHYTGVRHAQDTDYSSGSLGSDYVAWAIQETSLKSLYEPLAASTSLEELFADCRSGSKDGVAARLARLGDDSKLVLFPLAMLSALIKNADIFRNCVQYAMRLDIDIDRVTYWLLCDFPEMLDVLLEENWLKIGDSKRPLKTRRTIDVWMTQALKSSETGHRLTVLKWLLDHEVKIPGSEWRMMAFYHPSPEVFNFLLECYPQNILKFGMLQYAAKFGKAEYVKAILDAGGDPNQVPPSFGEEREPGPFRALWMVADANTRYGDPYEEGHLEAARMLLEKGGDVNLPGYSVGLSETALERARRSGDDRMLRLFEEYVASNE